MGSFFDRERLLHGGLVLSTLLSMAVGCRTAPCPDGTVRDGDVCRRVPADAGSDETVSEKVSPARASAAGSGNAGRAGNSAKTGTAPRAAGAAGVKGEDSAAAEVGGAGGASAGKSESGAGGASAKRQSTEAPAGAGAAGKPAAPSGAAGKPAAAQAGTGGDSSDQTGEGGSSGAAGDSAEPEGGRGASEETGGAGGSTSFPDPQWTCLQVEDSCVCVHAGSSAGDLCEEPRPTCCYLLPGSAGNCVCAPEGTQDCLTTGGNPGGMRVGQCPPPR